MARKGIAAAGNVPGERDYAVSWTDSSGNLWLFGGNNSSSVSGLTVLNDLWRYSPSTNLWTWMGGSNIPRSRRRIWYAGTCGCQQFTGSTLCKCGVLDRQQRQLAFVRRRRAMTPRSTAPASSTICGATTRAPDYGHG